MYEEHGVDVFPYVQPWRDIMKLSTSPLDSDRLREATKDRPFICHAFSLNGLSTFIKTWGGIPTNLRGLILDSAPGRVTTDLHARGFARAFAPNHPQELEAILRPVFRAWLALHASQLVEEEKVSNQWYDRPPSVPQLLVGSAMDEVIPLADLLDYVVAARQAGAPVVARIWPDSGHIRMWKDHPEEYRALVAAFLKEHLQE